MSLKKLLTGQPGNMREIAEYARQRNLPLNIVLEGDIEFDPTGYQLAKARAIYSIGTKEQEIAGKNKKLIEDLPFFRWLKTPSMYWSDLIGACNESIGRLKNQIQPNLKYLDSQSIKYQLFELNEAQNQFLEEKH